MDRTRTVAAAIGAASLGRPDDLVRRPEGLFFQAQAQPSDRVPQGGQADDHIQFFAKFLEREVGLVSDEAADAVIMGREYRRAKRLPAPRRHLAVLSASLFQATDPRFADAVLGRDDTSRHAAVTILENPLP